EIEAALLRLGLRVPGPRSFATVEAPEGEPGGGNGARAQSAEYRLTAGSEERFEYLGSRLVRLIRGETDGQF
ncbi:MAG TPA: hypothetical protein VGS23_01485, partial [Thermoplasmata archaeon]|nr:hypothetical protein [Thermoplasmata archaeon]